MSATSVCGGAIWRIAYEVKAGIAVIAGKTVWSIPELLECEVQQKAHYINTLAFTLPTFLTE